MTRRHKLRRLPLLSALIVFCWSLDARSEAEPEWAKRFDALIQQRMKENQVPGLAIGIIVDGRLAYSRGFGQAALGPKGPRTTPDTVYHMASVTKPFVATALMQLVEQGKLSLDDPIIKYLPYFRLSDPRYASLTIKQFVTHTSGMPDVEDYEWNKPQYDDGSLERYVRSLKDKKLLFAPGARFSYSNMAFEVLADVIAKASGQTFEDYVAQRILIPVGMVHSTLLKEKTDAKTLASGYTKGENGSPKPIPAYPYNRPHNASSDLMSSVHDMARWAMVNLNRGELDGKRILKTSTYDLMWHPNVEVADCPESGPCRKLGASVGLSWLVENRNGLIIISHNGSDDGFATQLTLVPDRKFAMVMMTNTDSPGLPFLKELLGESLALVK